MKNLNYLNEFRTQYMGMLGDEYNGCFIIPQEKCVFVVIASNGMAWEHVSLSIQTYSGKTLERCPKWSEMCELKDLFFEDDEVVMQLHPKKQHYVNIHPYTLHLWKLIGQEIPFPQSMMV